MIRVLRICGKAILWLLGAVAIVVAVLFAINIPDEAPTPEVARLLAAPENTLRPEENLYIALRGFDAKPGESTTLEGQRRIEADAELEKLLEKGPDAAANVAKARYDGPLPFVGNADLCQAHPGSCWYGIEARRKDIEKLLADNHELYRRYLELRRCRGYYETTTAWPVDGPAYVPRDVRDLYLAGWSLRMKTTTSAAQRSSLMTEFGEDIRLWREMLGAGSLISKMIALANLYRDYEVLADAIADPAFDFERLKPDLARVLGLMSKDDWNLKGLFAHEFRISQPMWRRLKQAQDERGWLWQDPEEVPKWWVRVAAPIYGHFFKFGATQNLRGQVAAQRDVVAAAGAEGFIAARDAFGRWEEDQFSVGLHYAYNPIGRTLAGIGMSAYDDYLLRAYDAAAYQRLLLLTLSARANNIHRSEIEAYGRQHPDWSKHSVNGAPALWHSDTGELQVQPLGHGGWKRYTASVWPRRVGQMSEPTHQRQ